MVGMDVQSLLSLVTLFFNRSVINNLDHYQPEYLPASYYFFHNISDPAAVPRPVVEDDIYSKSTLFPRCCQPGTVYDADNRGCLPVESAVSIHDELNITVNLIQSGLVHCKVIVDRFVKKNNLKLRDGNATLQIENKIYTSGNFCVDNILQDETVYVVRYCENDNYCVNVSQNVGNEWCVHKCCAEGFQLEDYRCVLNDRMGIHVKNNSYIFKRTDGYAMLYGTYLNCERADWNDFRNIEARIQANGNLYIGHSSREYLLTDYCLGTNLDSITDEISTIIVSCQFRKALYPRWIFIRIVIVITCVCFFVTLMVYIFVYRLKKLFEKIVSSFCVVELVFWCMYSLRIYDVSFRKFCNEFAYMYFFLTISRLAWLNVISYEIWRTISSLTARSTGQTQQALRKRMVCYGVYAVLIPTVGTLTFILGNQKVYRLPERFIPLVNKMTCILDIRRLNGNLGLLHFYIPVSILLTINILLFVKTTFYILKIKRDLKKISDSNSADKLNTDTFTRGFIILKLGLIMGLSSYSYYFYMYIDIFGNQTLREAFDILSFSDIFEGVIFLLVFVVKLDTLKSFLKRMNVLSPRIMCSNADPISKMENQATNGILQSRTKVT